MSLASALSNAISGLGATSRGTQVVSDNLANIKTKGYARRELQQSAHASGGGVRIDGIARVINTGLLKELRSADAARSQADVFTNFHKIMEKTIGVPAGENGLSHALNSFQASLINANAQPNDTVRLGKVANEARELANVLNSASSTVQAERRNADYAITRDVRTLNANLDRVSYLNRRIAVIHNNDLDPSALIDERQSVIDQINTIVPVQIALRDSQRVAVFTAEGATLLDGSKPVPISVTPTVYIGENIAGDQSDGERLYVNGKELTESGMRFFAGGSLASNFEIRDKLTLQLQRELDSLALELHDRFSDPAADPTIAGGKPGLFTDGKSKTSSENIDGLAARITLNSRLDGAEAENLWLLRSGLGAETAAPAGDASQINRFSNAITRFARPPEGSVFSGEASLQTRLAELESQVSTRRVDAENNSAIRNSRADAISVRFLADGVDSDVELQRLLQYEQAYAANAKVVQAVNEMMDQILRW